MLRGTRPYSRGVQQFDLRVCICLVSLGLQDTVELLPPMPPPSSPKPLNSQNWLSMQTLGREYRVQPTADNFTRNKIHPKFAYVALSCSEQRLLFFKVVARRQD